MHTGTMPADAINHVADRPGYFYVNVLLPAATSYFRPSFRSAGECSTLVSAILRRRIMTLIKSRSCNSLTDMIAVGKTRFSVTLMHWKSGTVK